jgi:AbrB family looped-hinge helix DNA binding protein
MGEPVGTTVDDRGRITLPQEMREAFGIRPGQEVRLDRTDRGILVRRATTPEEFIEQLEGCFDSSRSGTSDPLKAKDIWGAFHDHD